METAVIRPAVYEEVSNGTDNSGPYKKTAELKEKA